MDSGGFRWIPMDSSAFQWILKDSDRSWWLLMHSNGFFRKILIARGVRHQYSLNSACEALPVTLSLWGSKLKISIGGRVGNCTRPLLSCILIALTFEVASERELGPKNASIPTPKSFQKQFPNTVDSKQHESLIFVRTSHAICSILFVQRDENQWNTIIKAHANLLQNLYPKRMAKILPKTSLRDLQNSSKWMVRNLENQHLIIT